MASIELSREQRRAAITALQSYFEAERDEPIGELAAMLLLDFLAAEIGEIFYNKGVDDAQVQLRRQWAALDDDLEVLKLPERHPVAHDDDEREADEPNDDQPEDDEPDDDEPSG